MGIITLPKAKLYPGKDLNTKILIPGNGANNGTAIKDECGKTVTIHGNVVTSTSQNKFNGSSIYFPGSSGDYLTLAASSDFLFTGDLNIDFWYYSASPQECSFTGMNAGNDLNIYYYPGGNYFRLTFGGASSPTISYAMPTSTWVHMAVERISGVFKIAVQGTFLATTWTKTGNVGSSSKALAIGTYDNGSTTQYVKGYMNAFRMDNGVARWTSDFTPPLRPYF